MTKTKLKVSLIVLNYNCYEYTKNLIKTISEYDNIDSIVIVDNCSTDNSFVRLQELKSNTIHIIKSDKNGGYGYGNNFGIIYARDNFSPDIVVIANPDISFSKDSLSAMISTFISHQNIAAVAPMMKSLDSTAPRPTAWKVPTMKSELMSSSILLFKLFWQKGLLHFYPSSYYKSKDNLCFVDCIMGSFVAFDIKKLLSVGLYDTDFFLYCEESVLGYKFKQKGYRSIVLSNYSYIHYEEGSTAKIQPNFAKRKKVDFSSKLLYLNKYIRISKLSSLFCRLVFNLWIFEAYSFMFFNNFRRKFNG